MAWVNKNKYITNIKYYYYYYYYYYYLLAALLLRNKNVETYGMGNNELLNNINDLMKIIIFVIIEFVSMCRFQCCRWCNNEVQNL